MDSDRQRRAWPGQVRARIRLAAVQICFLQAACLPNLALYACGKDSDAASPRSSAKAETKSPGQININRATVNELKTLPGVGTVIAQRIVEYRARNPPFRRVEDLLIIRGISRNRLEQIRDRIRVD